MIAVAIGIGVLTANARSISAEMAPYFLPLVAFAGFVCFAYLFRLPRRALLGSLVGMAMAFLLIRFQERPLPILAEWLVVILIWVVLYWVLNKYRR